jgi:hypothetical protein
VRARLTLLKKDALQEGVLVAQHQALVGGGAMSSLEAVKVRLMDADGLLELLDVLGAALAEGRLGLAVTLLPLLRGSIDLRGWSV